MDIVIHQITARYEKKDILRDFSAVIPEKQTTVIMGSSGCGKTTLLYLLMNLLHPAAGTISGVPDKISVVFQEERLCEDFSAVENIQLVLRKKQKDNVVEDSLREIGLGDSLPMPVSQLSGGMRRRVAIVRAVLAESDAILLDEPFKGLDADTKATVINFLMRKTKGKTVILVTHDEEEATLLGDHVLRLEPVGALPKE